MLVKAFAVAFCLQIILPVAMLGNDGAAEVALGGIRLKQERRVAMVKERLFISKKKVRVEYVFLNESDNDVVTEIAFPIPEYWCNIGEGWAPFDDFKVWVNGTTLTYETEAHAWVDGKDITDSLLRYGIRIETFGDFFEGNKTTPMRSQMLSMSMDKRDQLVALGAIESVEHPETLAGYPLWHVKKNYHWTQKFPSRSAVRVEHEYTPCLGGAAILNLDTLRQPLKDWHNETADPACPDDVFSKAFSKAAAAHYSRNSGIGLPNALPGSWVRYILTTANTWKTPISDFELVVQRDPGELITFCWDGPLEKTGANTFRAKVGDFIPSMELTIYFIQP